MTKNLSEIDHFTNKKGNLDLINLILNQKKNL